MTENTDRYTQPFHRREKLHFECTGCGECCSGGGDYHVFVTRAEAQRMCAYLGLGWSWFRRRYLVRLEDGATVLASHADERCVFLDVDGRCRVYAARPAQCSTYPFWPEVLATAKAWRREARRCEGIGRGAVVPLRLIEEALRRIS